MLIALVELGQLDRAVSIVRDVSVGLFVWVLCAGSRGCVCECALVCASIT